MKKRRHRTMSHCWPKDQKYFGSPTAEKFNMPGFWLCVLWSKFGYLLGRIPTLYSPRNPRTENHIHFHCKFVCVRIWKKVNSTVLHLTYDNDNWGSGKNNNHPTNNQLETNVWRFIWLSCNAAPRTPFS